VRALAGLDFGGGPRLPLFLQTEAAECGLASLGMVACFHGHRIDLAGLRRRFTLSLKGATLAHLMQVAGRLDLAPRPLRLELDELPQLRAPCILHWDLNHFVVLKSANAREAVIHDPAFGVRRMPLAEVSKHFCPAMLATELVKLTRPCALHITHLKPALSDETMAAIVTALAVWNPQRLHGGQVIAF